MNPKLEDFRKYESIIQPMLAGASSANFVQEDAMSVQVERGLIFRDALLAPELPDLGIVERLIEVSDSARLPDLRVIDAAGQRRPVYPQLLIYSWMQAYQLLYETLPRSQFGRWEESLHAWCDLLERRTEIDWPAGAIPAALGAEMSQAAWAALTLSVAGKVFVRDAWTDLAADVFGRFVKRQLDSGAMLDADRSAGVETRGYDELVILHACASYAVQSEDRAVAKLVARSTEFHASEIQADHSTNQPWAVFAFIWNEAVRPTADQLLHAASTQRDGVSLMLLTDALQCLRLFTA